MQNQIGWVGPPDRVYQSTILDAKPAIIMLVVLSGESERFLDKKRLLLSSKHQQHLTSWIRIVKYWCFKERRILVGMRTH